MTLSSPFTRSPPAALILGNQGNGGGSERASVYTTSALSNTEVNPATPPLPDAKLPE